MVIFVLVPPYFSYALMDNLVRYRKKLTIGNVCLFTSLEIKFYSSLVVYMVIGLLPVKFFFKLK